MEPPAHVQMNYSEYTSKFQVSLTRAIINQGQLMPMSMETLLNNQKKKSYPMHTRLMWGLGEEVGRQPYPQFLRGLFFFLFFFWVGKYGEGPCLV